MCGGRAMTFNMDMFRPQCQYHPQGHSEAAKRATDAINLHWHAIGYDCVDKYVAVKLADGSSDGVLYETYQDAQRHQFDERLCAYIRLHPQLIDVCEAEIMLETNRRAYDAGGHLIDPDAPGGGKTAITPVRFEDRLRKLYTLRGSK